MEWRFVVTGTKAGRWVASLSSEVTEMGKIDRSSSHSRSLLTILSVVALLMGVLAVAPAGADAEIGGGGVIAFASTRDGDGDIWTVQPDGSELTNLTETTTNEIHPFWSPDGSQLVFVSDRTGNQELFVMNADGSAPAQLTDDAADDWGPVWSPDGSAIAFVSNRSGSYQVWQIDSDGNNPDQLTDLGGNGAYWPSWSPDSAQVVLTSNDDLFVVDIATGDTTNITNDGANQKDTAPAWSPNGTTIVWQSLDRGTPGWGGWDLWSMEIGAPPQDWQQLTVTTNQDEEVPAFSPDGEWIVYDINEATVWISRSDGTEATQITDSLGNRDAAWQPPGETPWFQVLLNNGPDDYVDGAGWTPDGEVQVTIDDGAEVHDSSSTAWPDGGFFVSPGLDIEPGFVVTVTDASSGWSATMTVQEINMLVADPTSGVVNGTAPGAAGQQLRVVGPSDCNGNTGEVWTTVAPDDTWEVDLDEIGGFSAGDDLGATHLHNDGMLNTLISFPHQLYATVNVADNWVEVQPFNPVDQFTTHPTRDVRVEVTDGISTWEMEGQTDPHGSYMAEFSIDIAPEMTVTAFDLTTGFFTEVHLEDSFGVDTIDTGENLIGGYSPFGGYLQVYVWSPAGEGHFDFTVEDPAGRWELDPGFEVTPDTGGWVMLFGCDGDNVVEAYGEGEPEPVPYVMASLTSDWLDAWGFTVGDTATFEIYDFEGGNLLFGPESRPIDGDGHYFLDGEEHGIDLIPGMFLTVTDDATSQVKGLTLEDLTLDSVDFDSDVVTGTAPSQAFVQVDSGNEFIGCGIEVQTNMGGDWSADFTTADCWYHETGEPAPVDLTDDMGVSVQLFDDDSDATIAEPAEPGPEPGISGAGANVHNHVVGSETAGYGIELHIQTYGNFGNTAAGDIVLTVDGTVMELEDRIELFPTDDGGWEFNVGGPYAATPTLGMYRVEVTDGDGVLWGFDIGELEDIPADAPHMVFPTNLALTTDTMPTISWESFESAYLGDLVTPWAYELNFSASGNDEEGSFVFPIDPGTTSIVYDNPNWEGEPLPLGGLEPGVYNVTVHSNHEVAPGFSFEHHRSLQFIIYDPTGGFVTGGGWIESPEGAYQPDPELSGKVTFGFVSKYKKRATVPRGFTRFRFRLGDLTFRSTSYDWLVVSGPNAKYKGTGTINGSGEYGFMVTACDVSVTGDCQGNSRDTFRIKIWDSNGDIVYDNQMGAPDGSYDGTVLRCGNIKIHKPKAKKM
ncbi:MAG: hypothetical protein GY722_15000 [bacterium]|nr:hypothetical protein [bacterium]